MMIVTLLPKRFLQKLIKDYNPTERFQQDTIELMKIL